MRSIYFILMTCAPHVTIYTPKMLIFTLCNVNIYILSFNSTEKPFCAIHNTYRNRNIFVTQTEIYHIFTHKMDVDAKIRN